MLSKSERRAASRPAIALSCARVARILLTAAAGGGAITPAAAEPPIVIAPAEGGPGAWRGQIDYLTPRGDAKENRPIDIVAVTVSHVWTGPYGLQGALGLGVMNAKGNRVEPGQSPVNSDATGLLLGGGARLAPVRIGPVSPFVEGSVHFLWTAGNPFPAGGSSVNGFVRWGGGVDVAVSRNLSLEAGFRAAHISNGGGLVPYNPSWNGHGGFIGLTWRPGR